MKENTTLKKVTDQQLINESGINRTTFFKMKKQYPYAIELMQKGFIVGMLLKDEVVNSLLKHKEEK